MQQKNLMVTTKRVFHGAPTLVPRAIFSSYSEKMRWGRGCGAPEIPLDKNMLVSVARSQSYRFFLHHIFKNFMLCIIRNIADKIYYSRTSRKLLKQCFTSFFSRNPSTLSPFYI